MGNEIKDLAVDVVMGIAAEVLKKHPAADAGRIMSCMGDIALLFKKHKLSPEQSKYCLEATAKMVAGFDKAEDSVDFTSEITT